MRLRLRSHAVLFAILGALCAPAMALDYRAAAKTSVLYETPAANGKKLYIVSADTPLEVVVTLEKWVKVRARDGKLAWIERSGLADHQTVVITADSATVRQEPKDDATAVFTANKAVILQVTGPAKGSWLPVRHADGESGFARRIDVWGY